MSMNKVRVFLIAFSLVFGGVSVTSHAGPEKANKSGFFKMIKKDITLSADQQEKIKALHEEYKPKMKAIRDQVKKNHESINSSDSYKLSESDLRAIHTRHKPLKMSLLDLQFEKKMKARALLTKDQLIQLAKKRSEKHAERKAMRESKKKERENRKKDKKKGKKNS